MAQFDVYRNQDANTRYRTPYLLDIQNDLFEALTTRIVVPLVVRSEMIEMLNLEIMIRGQAHVVSTQEICAIPVQRLRERVFSLKDQSKEILEAVAFLVKGFE